MKTKQVIISQPLLNAETMDETFWRVDHTLRDLVLAPSYYSIEIDLTDVRFIDPYGIICLCLLARYAKHYTQNIIFKLPESIDVQTYLGRMNFPTMVEPFALLENDRFASRYERNEESDVLLTVTPICNQQDIEDVTEFILKKVGSILEEKLNYEERDVRSFLQVLSELCCNVNDHSEDEGYTAVQTYTQRDGTKFVIIGVADLGVGIKASLSERYDVTGWSHFDAIRHSLGKECTRFRNEARGLGLYMVQRIIHEYDGRLNIRSGDARFYLRKHPTFCKSGFFPGTQISISLSEKKV